MRRGFMNMFPDMQLPPGGLTTGGPKAVDPKDIKIDVNGGKNQNVQDTVSVFSKHDNSPRDGNISYNEATATSIFNSGKLKDPTSLIQKPTVTSSGATVDAGKFSQLLKFDAVKAGQSALKTAYNNAQASLTGITQQLQLNGADSAGNARKEAIGNASKKLDASVEHTLSGAINNASADLMTKYQEALQKALSDYEKQNPDPKNVNGEGEQNVKDGKDNSTLQNKAGKSNANDFDTTATDNSKIESRKVFSTYDKSPEDGNVNYNEMKDQFKYNHRVQVMVDDHTPGVDGDALMDKIGDVQGQGQELFEKELSSFNKDVGFKEFSGKNALDGNKLAEATNKLNQKAEAAATKAQRKANDEVYQTLQSQVNRTISNALNGVKDAPPPTGTKGAKGAQGADAPNLSQLQQMAKGKGAPELTKSTATKPKGGGNDYSQFLAAGILQGVGTFASILAPQLGVEGVGIGSQFSQMGDQLLAQALENGGKSGGTQEADGGGSSGKSTQTKVKITAQDSQLPLEAFAKKNGVTTKDLLAANSTNGAIKDGKLVPGKELVLPSRA